MKAQLSILNEGLKTEQELIVKNEKELLQCVKNNIEEQKNLIMTEKES